MFLAKRFYSVDLNKVVILSFGGGGGVRDLAGF